MGHQIILMPIPMWGGGDRCTLEQHILLTAATMFEFDPPPGFQIPTEYREKFLAEMLGGPPSR